MKSTKTIGRELLIKDAAKSLAEFMYDLNRLYDSTVWSHINGSFFKYRDLAKFDMFSHDAKCVEKYWQTIDDGDSKRATRLINDVKKEVERSLHQRWNRSMDVCYDAGIEAAKNGQTVFTGLKFFGVDRFISSHPFYAERIKEFIRGWKYYSVNKNGIAMASRENYVRDCYSTLSLCNWEQTQL